MKKSLRWLGRFLMVSLFGASAFARHNTFEVKTFGPNAEEKDKCISEASVWNWQFGSNSDAEGAEFRDDEYFSTQVKANCDLNDSTRHYYLRLRPEFKDCETARDW